ncbi:SUN domain-containing protein 2 [Chelonia mydas]|uniref:SUN domain-containing protein 2 n=1 Tax=Chelonia mydas TaxID=8469 RepID=M7AP36_CHEMY|nr:SUN domain-containing protein 2 [Chelonia mydas]
MSRRSQRLGATRYYQGDDDGSSSGGSLLLGGQEPPFRDSPNRTLRRKPSSMKRLSPAPHLGPPPATQTSYYSESVISESYLGSSRGLAGGGSTAFDDPQDSDSYWGGELSARRRRGTGGTESSKINGLAESKTYDTYASSSGYSSEDDYAGRIFGLLYWWIGTTWYRLTTAASLLDVFVLTRSVQIGTRDMGKQALFGSEETPSAPPATATPGFHCLCLEKRFQTLEAEASRLEKLELQRGVAAGGGLTHEATLTLLEGLVSRREAALREDLALHVQSELDTIQDQLQKDLNGRLEKITQASQEVEARMLQLNSEWQSSTQEGLQGSFRQEMGRLEAQLAGLRKELALLASDQQAVVKHMESLPGQIKGVQEDPREDGVGSLVLQREELQDQLQKLERKILARVSEDQRMSARDAKASIGVALQQEGVTGVTEEQVHLIVNQALKRYSEDRTGMVDYALESGGASVISTRCSETYETKTALISLFGIPLWYHSQSPRVILQPDVNPGNCWAFRGSQGFAVIRLSSHIRPTAVTLEHVPKALLPLDTIPSAPKDFAVFGLDEEGQQEGIVLGQFTYNQDGDPIQTFHLEGEDVGTFQVVELRILSNWGHPEYTCIYRFRVHGEPVHYPRPASPLPPAGYLRFCAGRKQQP